MWHFFYLEKASDCLNHDIPICKSQFHGANGKAKLWLELYLNNRYQRAQVSDEESNLTSFCTWGKHNQQCSPGISCGPSVTSYLYQ
jgi:hypothetical protein